LGGTNKIWGGGISSKHNPARGSLLKQTQFCKEKHNSARASLFCASFIVLNCSGKANTILRELHCSVVTKRKLSNIAKLSIFESNFVTILS